MIYLYRTSRESFSQIRKVPVLYLAFLFEPMGRRKIFLSFSLLVEIEGNFSYFTN
jgi:hypothetical protein